MGTGMSPMVPSPLSMDPVSFQQWWQAVSSLNGSRPGTPLNVLNAAQVPFRMSSPTLEQMQAQQMQQQPDINALTAFANAQQKKKTTQQKGSKKQAGGTGNSRSASPANVNSNSKIAGNEGNLPLKASRHKYAEQRRRNRINERLDQLRTLVPHTEGSNIAGFLDQVIEYVMKLQQQLNIKPAQGADDKVAVPSLAQIKNLMSTSEGDQGEQAAPSKKRNSKASEVAETGKTTKRVKTTDKE